MGYYNNEANIICPFFKKDGQRKMKCEGFCSYTTSCEINFPTNNDKITHQDKFCATFNYENCALYKTILINKYEEGELL